MLNFFRRFTKSRFGVIAMFVFLALIAIAFAAGDITGIRGQSGGLSGNVLAKVGDRKITDREVRERIDLFLRNAQREGQNVTMEQFLAELRAQFGTYAELAGFLGVTASVETLRATVLVEA